MTIQETFAEWFRQLDPREQNVLLTFVKDHYFTAQFNSHAVEDLDGPASNRVAEPGSTRNVCPTCKREM
jgi:hypothetical protein